MANEIQSAEELKVQLLEIIRARLANEPQFEQLLRQAASSQLDLCLFGGALRDLMVLGANAPLRDIDIVTDRNSIPYRFLKHTFNHVAHNRFGGMSFVDNCQRYDVWALAQTWAFKNNSTLQASFDSLPFTTFLNVEAVALVFDQKLQERRVVEHGFFEAIRNRVIEINYEANPNPCGCIIRSLFTAQRLKFDIGPRLIGYIASRHSDYRAEAYHAFQMHHYQTVHFTDDELQSFFRTISEHYSSRPDESLDVNSLLTALPNLP